jgi:hypothetical protein
MATIPMLCEGRLERREIEIIVLTDDNHEPDDVNPVLLDESLLWFGSNHLAFGRKRWRGAQLRPRVAFDQIPDRIHTFADLSAQGDKRN